MCIHKFFKQTSSNLHSELTTDFWDDRWVLEAFSGPWEDSAVALPGIWEFNDLNVFNMKCRRNKSISRNHPKVHISNFILLAKKQTPTKQLDKCTPRILPSGGTEDTKPLFDLLQICLSTATEKVHVYLFMLLSLLLLFLSESKSGVYIVISPYTSKDCPAYRKQKN